MPALPHRETILANMEAQLKLVARPTTDLPVLLYYPNMERALRHLLRLRDSKHPPANARFLDREHMRALRAGRVHRGQIGPDFPESQEALLLHLPYLFRWMVWPLRVPDLGRK